MTYFFVYCTTLTLLENALFNWKAFTLLDLHYNQRLWAPPSPKKNEMLILGLIIKRHNLSF